jgi:hypothetical protein
MRLPSEQTRMAPKNKRADGRFQAGEVGNPNGRPKGSKNREKRLSIPDAVAAVQYAKRGISADEIAKALHARPEAVKEALGQSRQLLEAFAPEVAKDWIDASRIAAADGDHKPAMALLQSIKVVEPIAQTYDTGAAGAKAVAGVKVELHGFYCAGLPGLTPAPQPAAEPVTVDVVARSEG